MSANVISKNITRRRVIGGVIAGLAITTIPISALARMGQGAVYRDTDKVPAGGTAEELEIAKRACDEMHLKIGNRLDAIINDPAIDGEQTSLALMEARCPCCGERVDPVNSRISAVIPQWKQHITGPQKYGAKV